MVRKYILYIVSIVALLSSCTNREIINSNQTFNLSLGESKEVPFNLSNMIDSVMYLPLSGKNIGMVDEIKYVNGHYYLCNKKQGVINIYDEHGILLHEFIHKGRAKNEYISLGDFDVSFSDGSIHIFDDYTGRMLIYSKDFTFLKSKRVGNDAIKDFAVMSSGDYLMYKPDFAEESNRGLWISDKDMNFKKQLVSIDDNYKFGGIYPNYLIRISSDTLGLMGGEDKDNIYHITNDGIGYIYHIETDIDMTKSVKEDVSMNFEENRGHIYTKNSYIETSRWLTFLVTNMEKYTFFIYDKKNNIQHQITKEMDLVEDIKFYGNATHLYGDIVYSILYPETILNYPSLKKIFPDVTNDSNPVLMIAKYSK